MSESSLISTPSTGLSHPAIWSPAKWEETMSRPSPRTLTIYGGIAEQFRAWLDEQTTHAATLPAHLRAIADEALSDARLVHTQLSDGIRYLLDHDDALTCFRFMNRVMADQRTHSEVVRLRAEDDTLTVAAE